MSQLAFGSFAIDLRTSVLSKDGVMVPLSPKLVQVLACLADARGALVTRDQLLERFWPDVNIADNTLTRAIADIRKVLDDDAATPAYVQTMARRGYRFVAHVTEQTAPSDAPPAGSVPVSDAFAGLEPFVAWERGRSALESLSVEALPLAAEAFSRAVAGAPHYAPAHAGLANAHLFRFESTRTDNSPDAEALTQAMAVARRATELDPSIGEGWAVLGHALAEAGRADEARAALRQAVSLEPRNWRHQYRLAVATWGEDRLRAVERAEALLPGFPGTQSLAVMVHLARQSFEFAADAARRGAVGQSAQNDRSRYPANGLLWIRGLTSAARGDLTAALVDFAAETAVSDSGSNVYARECAVAAHESVGFVHLHAGQWKDARLDFAAADRHSPGHARAALGLALADSSTGALVDRIAPTLATLAHTGKTVERTLVLAAALAWDGQPHVGLERLDDVLAATAPESAGWSIAADPMFAPLRAADGYATFAARLASRAS